MDSEQKNRAYRRGLILGWTLAEIFLLILFILLLAFAASHLKDRERLLAEQKDAEKLVKQNDRLKLDTNRQMERIEELAHANAELHEQNVYLKARLVLPNNFDDEFRELRLRQRQIDKLNAQLAELNERQAWIKGLEEAFGRNMKMQANPQAALRELMARADDAGRALKTLRSIGVAQPQDQSVAEPVGKLLENLRKAGLTTGDSKEIAKRLQSLGDCQSERQQMQGQLANSQRKLEALGHGTEMPACWASLDGKPQYIFDVTLTSSGIVVHDNALADHVEDEKQFVKGMLFDTELKPEQFLGISNHIYQWSLDHKCRFFVRVFDHTGPGEKAIYKQHLQTVEAHFYKLLADQSGSAGATDSGEENAR